MNTWKSKISAVFASFILVLTFQNCANDELSFFDSAVADNLKYFNYFYKGETDHYFDIKVIPQDPSGGYRDYLIVGGVASSKAIGEHQITYSLRLLNKDGVDICPVIEGRADQETLIEQTCATTEANLAETIKSQIWVNGKLYEYSDKI